MPSQKTLVFEGGFGSLVRLVSISTVNLAMEYNGAFLPRSFLSVVKEYERCLIIVVNVVISREKMIFR